MSRCVTGTDRWDKIVQSLGSIKLSEFQDAIAAAIDKFSLPPFLPQLIHLEWEKYQVTAEQTAVPNVAETFKLNPTLHLVALDWKLSGLFENSVQNGPVQSGREVSAIWRDPVSKSVRLKAISKENLLALKFVEEDFRIDPVTDTGANSEIIAQSLRQTVKEGMIIPSRLMLRRDIDVLCHSNPKNPDLIYPDNFTLQWHVTNVCDLHCKHCYDRSEQSPLTCAQGKSILSDLKRFCCERYVGGHVCFTGGNPLLYPHFFELYAAAREHGFSTSILGNPTTIENLQRIVDIQKPTFFQVSLEGLEGHNDFIRGKGFFKRVFTFLDLLHKLEVRATVMLTLTKDNIDQILPLADLLRGHADNLAFNRLASVGEGANLLLPSKRTYADFLKAYVEASKVNPILGYKDNLINIVLDRQGQNLFRGCTRYGCGAAFNFIAVLPNGDAHACRKFPSPIGNLVTQNIAEIYDSPAAISYRRGIAACDGCRLRLVCGGCFAVLHGLGKNISKDRDPYCFIDR